MSSQEPNPCGVDSFREVADTEDSQQHPLERELCHRLDALQRYRQLITDAEAIGDDEAVEVLSVHFERQNQLIAEIREALQKLRPQNPPTF